MILAFGVDRGTLSELEARLLSDTIFGRQVGKLLCFPNALQTYMRRLKKAYPERIEACRSETSRFWRMKS